jgi:hypothetical protein
MRLIVGASCAVVLAAVTHLRAVDGALACADVAKLALPHGTITQVEAVAAGGFRPSERPDDYRSLPAFCRVAMTLAPSADSDIKVEPGFQPPTGTASSRQLATAPSAARLPIRRWPAR